MTLMEQIQKLRTEFFNLEVKDEYEAKVFCEEFSYFINDIEARLAEVAVEHQIRVHVNGPYGAGRWVSLEGNDYYGIEPGEWQASSQSC